MNHPANILYLDDGPSRRWWIGGLHQDEPWIEWIAPTHENVGAEALLDRVIEALHHQGVHPRGLVIAVPSEWCLSGDVETDGLPRRGRTSALLYRLESSWPIDVESVAVAFDEDTERAFGVAVEAKPMRSILDRFAEQGITVAHIYPAALLLPPPAEPKLEPKTDIDIQPDAADAVKLGGSDATGIAVEVCWRRRGRVDRLRYRGERLINWRSLPHGSDEPSREVAPTLFLEPALATTVYQETVNHDSGPLTRPEAEASCDYLAATMIQCVSDLLNTATPRGRIGIECFDLRRGPLAERDRLTRLALPLACLAWAAIGLAASVAATQWLQADTWRSATEQTDAAHAQLFHDTFAGQPLPLAVASRFRSEARAARDTDTPAGKETSFDVIVDLGRVLAQLPPASPADPAHLRYRVLELRLDSRGFSMDGQARSHGDAERLAAGFQNTPGLEFAAIRTETLKDRGVAFSLQADRRFIPKTSDTIRGVSR